MYCNPLPPPDSSKDRKAPRPGKHIPPPAPIPPPKVKKSKHGADINVDFTLDHSVGTSDVDDQFRIP